jgi:hypothetical protein
MSEAIATTDRQVALPTFSFLDSLPLKPMTEEEADHLTLAQRVERLKKIGDVHGRIRRLAKDYIRAFAPEIRLFLRLLDNQGSKEGTVLVDGKPVIINGKVIHGKQEAVKELFHVSYQYVFSILYPKLPKPKEAKTVDSPPQPATADATVTEVVISDTTTVEEDEGGGEDDEETDKAEIVPEGAVDAEEVQPEAAAEDQDAASSVVPGADALQEQLSHMSTPLLEAAVMIAYRTLRGRLRLEGSVLARTMALELFADAFDAREERSKQMSKFFVEAGTMFDDQEQFRGDVVVAAGRLGDYDTAGGRLIFVEDSIKQEVSLFVDNLREEVREKENSDDEGARSQELPSVIEDSLEVGRGNDLDHAAACGVALDYATDDAVDHGAFKPAVAVGSGNGDGCEAQQKEACDEVAVPEHEPHGTASLPCATPGRRKRAKYPPVPIVLEDGRCGHVIAGMGKLTKRTRYDVRLETGERVRVPKKAYGTPANLKGLSVAPKAWLVDGEAPLEKVPEFLKGQAPAQESGGGDSQRRSIVQVG